MVRVSDIYYNQRGRQENGCGQAKDHNKVRVQEVQSGRQARGQVRQTRVKTERTSKIREKEKAAARNNTLVDLTDKTNWQRTNREHRYRYPGTTEENR